MATQQKTGLRLGYKVPDFEAETTHGKIRFHDFIDGKWTILFSHVRSVSVPPCSPVPVATSRVLTTSCTATACVSQNREQGAYARDRQLMPILLAISPGISLRESADPSPAE